MGRRFTRASSEYVATDCGTLGALVTWGPFTAAAVVNRASGGAVQSILTTATSGGTLRASFYFDTDDTLYYFENGGGTFSGGTIACTTSDGWVLVAATKASGSAAARFHKYVFQTNTWTHTNGTGSAANATTPGAGGTFEVGRNVGFTEYQDGDIAAAMYIPRVLTDGEVERLSRGRWDMTDHVFLREFPLGADVPGQVGREQGRHHLRDTALTGGSRSAVGDPPGFRFSPANRRR